MNAFIDGILANITNESLSNLLGTDELREFSGKRLKEIKDGDMFYLSMREFAKHSEMMLHSGVLTSFIHSSMPMSCIVRLTKNVTYILLYMKNGRCNVVLQSDLDEKQLEEYKERIR